MQSMNASFVNGAMNASPVGGLMGGGFIPGGFESPGLDSEKKVEMFISFLTYPKTEEKRF